MIKYLDTFPVILSSFIKYLTAIKEDPATVFKKYTINGQCLLILQYLSIKYPISVNIENGNIHIKDIGDIVNEFYNPNISSGSVLDIESITKQCVAYCNDNPY